jgi:hypothetical protein
MSPSPTASKKRAASSSRCCRDASKRGLCSSTCRRARTASWQQFASLVTAARGAFVNGLNEILLVAAVVALTGSALSFLLVRRRDFVHEVDDTAVEEQALELAA